MIHPPQFGVVDDAEKATSHCVGLMSLSSSSSSGLVNTPQNCTEPFDFLEVKEEIEIEIFAINDPPLVPLHKAKTLANL